MKKKKKLHCECMHENMILSVKNIWGGEESQVQKSQYFILGQMGMEAVLSFTLGLGLGVGLAMTKRNLSDRPPPFMKGETGNDVFLLL